MLKNGAVIVQFHDAHLLFGTSLSEQHKRPMRLSLAGFAATAVTFGPARNGYGLFLPYFREEFGLSTLLLGLIASGLYLGYLLALCAVGLLASRVGPLPFITAGLVSAALGMALVAFAPNAPLLAVGVVLAGSSAGWSWAPYNDAVAHLVAQHRQGRVLSVISTGTTFGILAAGLSALLVGADWRVAWLAFAGAAVVALAPNVRVLRGLTSRADNAADSAQGSSLTWRDLVRSESVPLFVVAASFGVVSAFYFSFAVDLIVSTGVSRTFSGPALYTLIGVAGASGLFTGDAVGHFGIKRVLLLTLLCLGAAAFVLGLAPSSWAAIGVSAALFGVGVMVMSALLSIWSSSVFAAQPSVGFSATLVVFGVGLTLGPVTLGALANPLGLDVVFLVSGGLTLLTGFAQPAKDS